MVDLLKLTVLLLFDLNLLTNGDSLTVLLRKENIIFDSLARSTLILTHQPRLAPFLSNWSSVTNDAWVLNIIQFSYLVEFIELPPISHVKFPLYNLALELEIASLLEKQAIQQVPDQDIPNGFYSCYFLVPKKDGGIRPILDLRKLNTYLHPRRFRMTTLESIVHLETGLLL